jgi:hypothetical protein
MLLISTIYYPKSKNIIAMKKIKNILIPADFPIEKNGILTYAKALAQVLNSEITVLKMKANFSNTHTQEDEIDVEKKLEILVNYAADDSKTQSKIPIKSKILTCPEKIGRGAFSKFIPSKKGDLLVINHSNLSCPLSKSVNFGISEASNKANCPVLLVPNEAKWLPIEQILFTNNIESITPAMVRTMSDFAEQFDAVIHFVHIPENERQKVKSTEKIWLELYEKAAASSPFKLHKLSGSNMMYNLKKYIQKHRINLTAFVNKKRCFWQGLMHTKITQNIAFTEGLPVLIMPCNSLSKKTKLSGKMNNMFNGYTMEGVSHFT